MDVTRRVRRKRHQAAPAGGGPFYEDVSDTPVWAGTSAMGLGLGFGTVVGLWVGPIGAALGVAAGVAAGVFYDRWLERMQTSRTGTSAEPGLVKRHSTPPRDASL